MEGNGIRFKCDLPNNPDIEKQISEHAMRMILGGGGGGNIPSEEYSVRFVFDQYIAKKLETNQRADANTKKEHLQMLNTLIKLLGAETNYAQLTFDDAEQLCLDILKLTDSRAKDKTKAKPYPQVGLKKFWVSSNELAST